MVAGEGPQRGGSEGDSRVLGELGEILELFWLRGVRTTVDFCVATPHGSRGLALASPSGRGFPWSIASPLIGTIWRMEPGSHI